MTDKQTNQSTEELIEVRLISKTGETALMQYVGEDGTLHRVLVLAKHQHHKRLSKATISRGLPVDDKLGKVIDLSSIVPASIEHALKQRGIFTIEDALSNPVGVQKAFAATMDGVVTKFFMEISEQKKRSST